MLDREVLIGNLNVGDIFHAEYSNGASCICLVLSVNDRTIEARRVTSQENLKFDRHTGIEKANDRQALAVINSVAPLPPEIHSTFLALDEKYGAVHGRREVFERNPEYYKLTDAEKKAFRFVDFHYSSNPLPPPLR
jgi:hypothetical protein